LFFTGDVNPEPIDGRDIFWEAAEGGDVGHARIHVHGPDGVTHGLVLLEHGLVVLHVFFGIVDGERVAGGMFFAAEIVTALVEEELGQVEVGVIAGRPEELGEADLDLRVAGEAAAPAGARAECAEEEAGVLFGDGQERALAGGLEMGHGRFVHVADVVEFVADAEVRPALGAGAGSRMGGVVRPCRIEIAVRFLGLRDEGDEIVERFLEGGVGVETKCVGDGFHGLVDVGVVESPAFVGAHHEASGLAEIVDPARFFIHPEGAGNGDRAVRFEARRPEGVGELDLGEGDGADGVVEGGRRGVPGRAAGEGEGEEGNESGREGETHFCSHGTSG